MDVGILLIFQNYLGRGTDEDMVRAEMRVAELAEPLGFDKIWAVEHHFTDYAACPDNVQFLSWLAGRTSHIQLATGAVIVPWNQPLRVAEKMALLDHLSDGR
ncbi:MAG: LLM class flavin-dependent oxidoreductase, partial [Myxococcota bacterium]